MTLATALPPGAFAPIDVELGDWLHRYAVSAGEAETAEVLGITGCLLSHARRQGHACLPIAAIAGGSWEELGIADDGFARDLPNAAVWSDRLRRSTACGDGSSPTPLVLPLHGDRVFLHRFWHAERRLAELLRARRGSVEGALTDELPQLLDRLFPPLALASTDWQRVAAFAGLRQRLTVITGGPGTGKTTTVARLLALIASREPGARMALATPTGKAAARLSESIRSQVGRLDLPEDVRERIPCEAVTIHRLLGSSPRWGGFWHGAHRPLTCDALVVDEASMIDQELMTALLEAVPAPARVILIGDPFQLASVDAGSVLGDLRAVAGNHAEFSDAFVADYQRCSHQRLRVTASPRFEDGFVELAENFRFAEQPGIAKLADAIRRGDVDRAALATEHADVARSRPRDEAGALESIAPRLEAYLDARDPATALEVLRSFRVLCAHRHGRWSTAAFNHAIERWLSRHGYPIAGRHYRGRPLLIERNDYRLKLNNGDVGVCWPGRDGRAVAWFDGEYGLREVPATQLPQHDTAFAMTVHKSQGSEFDEVLLVLPDADSPLCTREWLYTGVTRAHRQLHVAGTADALDTAIRRPTHRWTGLRELLGP